MADYDTSSIKIDPHQLAAHGDTLKNLGAEVGNLLEQVSNTGAQLKLGWVGKTAEEVEQFNNKWTGVMTELFGTDDKNDKNLSHSGVINVISGGVKYVADGFSQVENSLASGFNTLSANMSKPPDPNYKTPTSPPGNADSSDNSAVSERWT